MIKSKRIVILLLLFSLLFALASLSAMAETTENSAYLYGGFRINSVEYKPSNSEGLTIASAVASAQEGDVFTLTHNVDMNLTTLTPEVPITIDLAGKSITNASLFLKNCGVEVNIIGSGTIGCTEKLIDNNSSGTTVIGSDNNVINVIHNTSSAVDGSTVMLISTDSGKVTVKNTAFESNGVAVSDASFFSVSGSNATFEFISSSFTSSATEQAFNSVSHRNLNYVFSCKGTSTVRISDSSRIVAGYSAYRGLLCASKVIVEGNSSVIASMGAKVERGKDLNISCSEISALSSVGIENSGNITITDSIIKSVSGFTLYNVSGSSSFTSISANNSIIEFSGTGSDKYALCVACPSKSIDFNNCQIISSMNCVSSTADTALNFGDCYIKAGYNAFSLEYTSGIKIDESIIISSAKAEGYTFYFPYSAYIALNNDDYIINVTDSTIFAQGNSSTDTKSYLLYADVYDLDLLTGKIGFSSCDISFGYRLARTGLTYDHAYCENQLVFEFNNTRVVSINRGQADGFFEGEGNIVKVNGKSKFIHSSEASKSLDAKIESCEGAFEFAIGTRLSFIPNDIGFCMPSGYKLIYDPIGDAEAPYVVSKGTDCIGYSTSFNNVPISDKYDSENYALHNIQIGNLAEGTSFVSAEANNNAFLKYIISNTQEVEANAKEGKIQFSSSDYAVFGGGFLNNACIKNTVLSSSEQYNAKSVLILSIDFSAGSDSGFVAFDIGISAKGDSRDVDGAYSYSDASSESFLRILSSEDCYSGYAFEASSGNTYFLRDNNSWNTLKVIVDVLSNKAYVYLNGDMISAPDGISAFNSESCYAEFIEGFRISFVENHLNSVDASACFDNYSLVSFDKYVSGEFLIDDYLNENNQSMSPVCEEIVAGGKFYASVTEAIDAVDGTGLKAKLIGNVPSTQRVSSVGKIYTFGYYLPLTDDEENLFLNYDASDSACGKIYSFSPNYELNAKINLSLYSSFDINLYIPAYYKSFIKSVEINEVEATDDYRNYIINEEEHYYYSCGRASNEAAESVIFAITFMQYGKDFRYTFNISILDYVDKVMEDCDKSDPSVDHILMYYILNYANEASAYFDQSDSIKTVLDGYSDLNLPQFADLIGDPVEVDSLRTYFNGHTLALDETPSIRLVLKEQTEEKITAKYTDIMTGKLMEANVCVDGITVDFYGIKIYNLAQTFKIYVGDTYVGDYNLAVYKEGVLDGAEEEALVKALCNYISFAKIRVLSTKSK